ncbi:hypothetical protein J7E62_24990 [Variovorax paradoxus]|nr:hypothetical protein [Variovorax paradoxus]
MSRKPLQIRLGSRWTFFTYSRTDVRLLGTVQDGMQIGAFAQLEDGSYAQINGDVVRVLNSSRVKQALGRDFETYFPSPSGPRSSQPAAVPTVIIKKRRVIQLPAAEAAGKE